MIVATGLSLLISPSFLYEEVSPDMRGRVRTFRVTEYIGTKTEKASTN
jgi:hypothetical protein